MHLLSSIGYWHHILIFRKLYIYIYNPACIFHFIAKNTAKTTVKEFIKLLSLIKLKKTFTEHFLPLHYTGWKQAYFYIITASLNWTFTSHFIHRLIKTRTSAKSFGFFAGKLVAFAQYLSMPLQILKQRDD